MSLIKAVLNDGRSLNSIELIIDEFNFSCESTYMKGYAVLNVCEVRFKSYNLSVIC